MRTADLFLQTELKDDSTDFGGISFAGETLEDFLNEIGEPLSSPMDKVNEWLTECGIKPIEYYTIAVDSESDVDDFSPYVPGIYNTLNDAVDAAIGMVHMYDGKSLAILHVNNMYGETVEVAESQVAGINC